MTSHSKLEQLVYDLLPQLTRELSAVQDSVRTSTARLKKVPEALLQNGSNAALQKAIRSLDVSNDALLESLRLLHAQYPSKVEVENEKED